MLACVDQQDFGPEPLPGQSRRRPVRSCVTPFDTGGIPPVDITTDMTTDIAPFTTYLRRLLLHDRDAHARSGRSAQNVQPREGQRLAQQIVGQRLHGAN